MLASLFSEEDFPEDEIQTTANFYLNNKIINYFKEVKNKSGKTIMEINDSFPSKSDVKFIKEAELVPVLDYCYPLLEKLFEKENSKDTEKLSKDTFLIIKILEKLAKNNIPKAFSAGMLYYEVRHLYGF